MIDRILESSLRQRAFVLFGAAALLAAASVVAFAFARRAPWVLRREATLLRRRPAGPQPKEA